MENLLANHYVRLVGEALLAGLVAFGVAYQATGDLKAAISAGTMAALFKAFPSVATGTPTTPPVEK